MAPSSGRSSTISWGSNPERVNILQGDTDVSAFGMGTGGSRSTIMTGSAMTIAARKIIDKGRQLAAYLLEASDADIEFADGKFTVAGTDKEIDIHEIAVAAFKSNNLPEDMEPGLYETGTYNSKTGNFPQWLPCLRGRGGPGYGCGGNGELLRCR